MINNKLVLHAIIFKKDMYKTANEVLNKAIDMFPHESIKGFVRETIDSFRVRVRPKTQFIKTDYVSKIINPDITIVMGKLKDEPKIHLVDFEKLTIIKNKKANQQNP